ncbi:AsnC family transcriptional regulator [Paenibacillus lautus]|uniref:Lrp/AsnC family transcriptional regulator n=1 Tax=Paenibacillus lautus TaxID=1401 RepID=UPI001B197C94|nr:winged helix-turn-helix transcriptional regulator [Paenibacillus lautus]GIP03657.1 AsnC family transcriptional regulator [Paenibacillus lautus]
MDQIDLQILEFLKHNARISFSELGRKVNMTQPAVSERVKRLEEKGVITEYRTVLSAEKMGKGVTAFILIQASHCGRLTTFAKQSQEVVEIYQVSGQYNFLMKIETGSMKSLETFIYQCSEYGHTTTMTVLSMPLDQQE